MIIKTRRIEKLVVSGRKSVPCYELPKISATIAWIAGSHARKCSRIAPSHFVNEDGMRRPPISVKVGRLKGHVSTLVRLTMLLQLAADPA